MVRVSLRDALQKSRSLVRSRGHEWDVADVTGTIDEYDATHDDAPIPPERLAALSTGTDLRRAALEAITLLSHLTDLPEHATLVVRHVINLLDVPEAGDSLQNLATHAPHHGRVDRHPEGVYPPPRDRDDPKDISHDNEGGVP